MCSMIHKINFICIILQYIYFCVIAFNQLKNLTVFSLSSSFSPYRNVFSLPEFIIYNNSICALSILVVQNSYFLEFNSTPLGVKKKKWFDKNYYPNFFYSSQYRELEILQSTLLPMYVSYPLISRHEQIK